MQCKTLKTKQLAAICTLDAKLEYIRHLFYTNKQRRSSDLTGDYCQK